MYEICQFSLVGYFVIKEKYFGIKTDIALKPSLPLAWTTVPNPRICEHWWWRQSNISTSCRDKHPLGSAMFGMFGSIAKARSTYSKCLHQKTVGWLGLSSKEDSCWKATVKLSVLLKLKGMACYRGNLIATCFKCQK